MSADFLSAAAAAIGEAGVVHNPDMRYLTDWRGRESGQAIALLRPHSTAEVSVLLQLCTQYQVAITPQGGNTGLVLGSTPPPQPSRPHVVLSLLGMQKIEPPDLLNNTVVAEAGCVLQDLQNLAAAHNRLFPLSLAAESSCTIGGNLATNAGGVQVLRYGNMRALCVGLEVVLADGTVLNQLRALHKNNSGYDLRDLFIGSEGTLGIITRAALKLFAAQHSSCHVWLPVPTVDAALELFQKVRARFGHQLCSFELMQRRAVELVIEEFPIAQKMLLPTLPFVVLISVADSCTQTALEEDVQGFLHSEKHNCAEAIVAQNIRQAQQLWFIREHIPLAEAALQKSQQHIALKHDIALPLSAIADFVSHCGAALHTLSPFAEILFFGHCGDGNLHYNVLLPASVANPILQKAISECIWDAVEQRGGSFSAEHGVGRLRVAQLQHYRSTLEVELMKKIKHSFDPHRLLNPGVIVPDE